MGATGAMVRTLLRSVLLVAVVTGARGEDDHDHDHDGHVDEEGHMEVGGWVCVPCVSALLFLFVHTKCCGCPRCATHGTRHTSGVLSKGFLLPCVRLSLTRPSEQYSPGVVLGTCDVHMPTCRLHTTLYVSPRFYLKVARGAHSRGPLSSRGTV
jgi:hypothetical protein